MPTYNKLIRDKITEIIDADGKSFRVRTLDEQEFRQELQTKLREEVSEYLEAADNESALEELADILEVVNALTEVHGFSPEHLEQVRLRKAEKRGSFKSKMFLLNVDECVSQLKSAEYRGHFVHSTANTEIYEFTLDRA